ncbi:MAG: DUF2834 domain-containing protein [Acidimicrobiia bacterium]|nr:DUF2834 domain-containing protein [Acidimicrobiia bacterium]NNL48873.1 DUF2834 domain-containing protein [Acidimicrobiia bacterium]
MKRIYAGLAVVGAVVPWLFFAGYFADADRLAFRDALFGSPLMTGFVFDLSISIIVWLIWSYRDARVLGIRTWWLVPAASLTVGLSLALPLYLFLRHDHVSPMHASPKHASQKVAESRPADPEPVTDS